MDRGAWWATVQKVTKSKFDQATEHTQLQFESNRWPQQLKPFVSSKKCVSVYVWVRKGVSKKSMRTPEDAAKITPPDKFLSSSSHPLHQFKAWPLPF